MADNFTYLNYVTDETFLNEYNAYQAKYADSIRESDRVILQMVAARARAAGRPLRLLDVGCSTGNLLGHLRAAFPAFTLVGGDLAESSLSTCRENPRLAGVEFKRLDILRLPTDERYDVITVNAVLYMMDDEQFVGALESLAGALATGGTLIVFDFFHGFPQDVSIIEVSQSHPHGLRLRFRRMDVVSQQLERAGFTALDFRPFDLPIDLPPHPDAAQLITYTVPTADGRRLPFRGTLFQPWCHLAAVKA